MQIHSSHDEVKLHYDPVFILRFSIHCLSKAYIEPVEFAGSGLLAIAFVGMSSPDLGIRRLAYGTLDKFKNALEVGNGFISSSLLFPYHHIEFHYGSIRFTYVLRLN